MKLNHVWNNSYVFLHKWPVLTWCHLSKGKGGLSLGCDDWWRNGQQYLWESPEGLAGFLNFLVWVPETYRIISWVISKVLLMVGLKIVTLSQTLFLFQVWQKAWEFPSDRNSSTPVDQIINVGAEANLSTKQTINQYAWPCCKQNISHCN